MFARMTSRYQDYGSVCWNARKISAQVFGIGIVCGTALSCESYIYFIVLLSSSNKTSRIQTTNLQPEPFTRLSRQNTINSLTASSDKLFDHDGDVILNDYHLPLKPGVSFAASRPLSLDTRDNSISENWPNVFQHFYVSQPPSATRLQNDLTFV